MAPLRERDEQLRPPEVQAREGAGTLMSGSRRKPGEEVRMAMFFQLGRKMQTRDKIRFPLCPCTSGGEVEYYKWQRHPDQYVC